MIVDLSFAELSALRYLCDLRLAIPVNARPQRRVIRSVLKKLDEVNEWLRERQFGKRKTRPGKFAGVRMFR